MAEKIGIIRSKKAMQAAKGRSCVLCGINDGTIRRCHYEGIRQHQYGKAKGIKGHDCLTADLCSGCNEGFERHEMADNNVPKELQKIEQSELFLHCIALTVVRDLKEGVLIYK